MKKEIDKVEEKLCKLGYEIIGNFVTKKLLPIGRCEEISGRLEKVFVNLISPKKVIEKYSLEDLLEQLKKDLKDNKIPYRNNGNIIIGEQEISWEDYKKIGY